jgi:hypothetical protein
MRPVPPPRAFRPLDSEGAWEKRLNQRPLFVLKFRRVNLSLVYGMYRWEYHLGRIGGITEESKTYIARSPALSARLPSFDLALKLRTWVLMLPLQPWWISDLYAVYYSKQFPKAKCRYETSLSVLLNC